MTGCGRASEHARVSAPPGSLVLGSASPRRRELLRWLVPRFTLDVPDVPEEIRVGESPAACVHRLARAKAVAIGVRRPVDWVLTADTIVEIDGTILGKPTDRADAARMLARLAGREHRVVTGFVLAAPGGDVRADEAVLSRVHFRPLASAAIADYVGTGESDDKAGAYAVQGRGAALVARIDGSVTNVIGLPLDEVERALTEAGLLGE